MRGGLRVKDSARPCSAPKALLQTRCFKRFAPNALLQTPCFKRFASNALLQTQCSNSLVARGRTQMLKRL